jgi:hypothetical protein
MTTLTAQQARDRAEQYARETATALGPDASLAKAPGGDVECDDLDPPGRVTVGADYFLTVPATTNRQVMDTVYTYWTARGFSALDDSRTSVRPRLTLQNNTDGFRIGITEGGTGGLSLGASSPCVWPNGTPPTATDGQ